MPPPVLPKDTKLLRLVSARQDMGCSLEAFGVLHSLNDTEHPAFYHAAVSMAVCYGRPFLESNGLGRLQVDLPDYPDFSDPEMNLRHHRMIDLRNKFMAHSNCEGTKILILPPGSTNPLTRELVDRHDHMVGKRIFGDLRFFDWLKDVVVELKGRLDVEVHKRLVEVAGSIDQPTEMQTDYDDFKWTIPPPGGKKTKP